MIPSQHLDLTKLIFIIEKVISLAAVRPNKIWQFLNKVAVVAKFINLYTIIRGSIDGFAIMGIPYNKAAAQPCTCSNELLIIIIIVELAMHDMGTVA